MKEEHLPSSSNYWGASWHPSRSLAGKKKKSGGGERSEHSQLVSIPQVHGCRRKRNDAEANCSQQVIKHLQGHMSYLFQSRLAQDASSNFLSSLWTLISNLSKQSLRFDEVPMWKLFNSFYFTSWRSSKRFLSITTGKLEDFSVVVMCNVSHHFQEIRHDSVWKSPLNVKRLRPSSPFL